MKRVLTVIGILCIAMCLFAGYADSGLEYEVNPAGDIVITGYSGTNAEVVIPDMINEKPVVEIAEKAFKDNNVIRTVAIPDSVVTIGDEAFSKCKNLEEVKLPSGLSSISYCLFGYCSKLNSIEIPQSVVSIGEWAFTECRSLRSLVIPDGVVEIGAYAFNKCDIESIDLPDSITTIGVAAFRNCYNLVSITLPENLIELGSSAFGNCDNLTEIYIPIKTSKIEVNVFYDCDKLSVISVSPSHPVFAVIDNVLFNKQTKTLVCYPAGLKNKSYSIPNGIQRIAPSAFEGCGNLEAIEIPDSVQVIGYSCFESCKKLTNVRIPNSVTTIGSLAFSRCKSLTDVVIPDSVTLLNDQVFFDCGNLKSVTLPSNIHKIEMGLFSYCKNLEKVNIPISATWINSNAFRSTGLNSLYLHSNINYISTDAFEDTDLVLFVEEGTYAEKYCHDNNKLCMVIKEDGEGYKFNSFDVSLKDNEITILSCVSDDDEITIPSSIKDMVVTSIADGALINCKATRISLPSSITYIGEYVFNTDVNPSVSVDQGTYAEQYCLSHSIPIETVDPLAWLF